MRSRTTRPVRFALAAFAVLAVTVASSHAADSLVINTTTGKCSIPGVDDNGVLKQSLGGEFDLKAPGSSPIIICRGKVTNELGKAYTQEVAVSVDGTNTTARLTIAASGQATAVVKKP